jgi:hypothetical protein
MKVGCPWCELSVPLYKSLLKQYRNTKVHFAVVMPEPIDQQQLYLRRLNLPIDDLKQLNLDQLEIAGTPTVFVLDKWGNLLCGWTGFEPNSDQQNLQNCINGGITKTQSDNRHKSWAELLNMSR